jgi:two-component system nitrate/nitrite response regulator NarL
MRVSRRVKLLLVDDHALVREGIRSSLIRYPFIAVVGEAANGKEAVRKCKELRPDIVLMDLNMPEMSGLEATPLIRKNCPKTKIIVLTVHDTKEYVFQLLRSGAHGYVTKDTSPEELVRAIESVARGDSFFSPSVSRILHDFVQSTNEAAEPNEEPISGREKEVLQMIAGGKTSKEVASHLNLSTRTVETYRVRLKRKLKARNLAELLNHAREQQLL